ncbi:SHOCT domain-containing protein [Rhodococcus sp. NPDC056960]|uniref:SHOCT domain-containing protein n=1 Tax=Rhodococcus sp. NPDC056960 TaxID=3345982 RepID=UPI00362E791F
MEALAVHLYPGEIVWAVASTSAMYPPCDGLVITNARLLAFAGRDVGASGPKSGVDADSIHRFDFTMYGSAKTLVVTTRSGQQMSFGSIPDEDAPFIGHYVHHLTAAGFPAGMRPAAEAQRAEAQTRSDAERRAADERAETARREAEERAEAHRQAVQQRAHEKQQKAQHREEERAAAAEQKERERRAAEAEQERIEGRRSQVEVFGPRVTKAAWRYLEQHSHEDEWPWFVVASDSMGGVLAAFEDRLMIVKTGGYTSFMAGSLGGGRVTTFPYTEITNIEFNGGIVNGVLEILTPSYQGSAQHDYWRNSNKSRNKAADDPFTLSNCLPLGKALYKRTLPRLNELQRKIADCKRPNIVVQVPTQPQPSGGGLAEELRRLADLHAEGVLDVDEFATAKQAAIRKYS